MPVVNYRDLRVWQAGMDLVEVVYRVTEGFPPAERYGLTSQMRRAAVAIPSNIAEGHTKAGARAFLYHVSVALGSLAELETQTEIAERLSYVPEVKTRQVLKLTVPLGKQPFELRNSLLDRGP